MMKFFNAVFVSNVNLFVNLKPLVNEVVLIYFLKSKIRLYSLLEAAASVLFGTVKVHFLYLEVLKFCISWADYKGVIFY